MSNKIISVKDVSKMYNLKHKTTDEDKFLIKSLFERGGKNSIEEFWALKDINFEINKGDKVGIIGRNGAGKSTLLKILSRIVAPTSGRIEYEGRVASLLEVGTGFHPELSGRENIFLNGSILGMTKKEITSKFDEIVDFAEVENFLDTPVKRYSSGMYVRLAFAVAAHLEPEILIVDEVLAVGDSAFQKKCLGKMNEISNREGKTILFVSHNMAAIQNLCNKSFVLKNGKMDTPVCETHLAVKHYIKDSIELSKTALTDRTDREGEGLLRFTTISLEDKLGNKLNGIHCGEEINFVVELKQSAPIMTNISIAFTIYSDEGYEMLNMATHISKDAFKEVRQGQKITCTINKCPLTNGGYIVNATIYKDLTIQDYVKEAFSFNVFEGDYYGNGRVLPGNSQRILIENNWSIK